MSLTPIYEMEKIRLFILLNILCVIFSSVYGENPTISKYNNEEVKAINQFVYKLIDAERLSTFNKTNEPLMYIFDTRLICDLEKTTIISYKANYLINKLKRRGIIDRNIDSTSIRKFDKARFIFINNDSVVSKIKDTVIIAGRLNLSRISFNKSFTTGYFFYSVSIDSSSGWGGLMRIEKRNGKWKYMGGPMYII